jgi:thiol-disulfide isomerase/thioredoxin
MHNHQTFQLLMTFILVAFVLIVLLNTTTSIPPNAETFSQSNAKLLFFYADWCPHCITLKPIIEELKKANTINIEMLEDKSTDSKLKKEFNIEGYPTIYYVDTTMKILYEGPRTIEGLRQFIKTCRP